MTSSSRQLCDLGLGVCPLGSSVSHLFHGFARMAALEPAWLRTESSLGLVAFVAVADAITIHKEQQWSLVLRLNPGVHSSCLYLVSVAKTFLCAHGSTQHHSRCLGSVFPGRQHLILTCLGQLSCAHSSTHRALRPLVWSHTAGSHRDPWCSSYSLQSLLFLPQDWGSIWSSRILGLILTPSFLSLNLVPKLKSTLLGDPL